MGGLLMVERVYEAFFMWEISCTKQELNLDFGK